MFGGRTLEPICLLIEMMEGKGRLLFQEQSRNEEVVMDSPGGEVTQNRHL